MTALASPHVTHGRGWTAIVHPAHIELRIDQHLDPLPEAIRDLLPPSERWQWTVEYVDDDSYGRDIYIITKVLG